ncbi:MAG: carbohydrate binding family 9 domain-containing protein [Bacteroidia bacterium]|nr:carbohydrate binding family 9 domain-containing protein [Bacteroidia bacterium]
MKKRVLVLIFLISSFYNSFSQKAEKKSMNATRISESIKIDAELGETVWQRSDIATDFIQSRQDPGDPASQKTEVRILYDDKAIYVFAVMYEVSKDSILRELSKRDDIGGNTDYFGVYFDTYNSGLNAFGFELTPAGVQADGQISPNNGFDDDWDAVWESAVQLFDNKWQVEMRIPYSALRFSEADVQTWGVNFSRRIRRFRQEANWNFVNPEESGFVTQFGILTGISNIKAPIRLSITPFVSAYAEHFPHDAEGIENINHTYNGGLDLKYGISESFTLDMVLIPDFGQVRSDNQVLNLSPFETRFSENRPFFTEGTDLFSKGGIFYTRRVGGKPIGIDDVEDELEDNEEIDENPIIAELINATKVSGRTKSGLGIGVFNGISKRTYATIKDTITGEKREVLTSPITNYNVLVLDQNLKNNSSVSLINTNLSREGSYYDANVTAAEFSLKDKKQKYRFSGGGALSQILNQDDTDLGYQAYWSFNKISGNWQFYSGHTIESDTYNPNDLGFLFNNNENSFYGGIQYLKFKPFWKLNRLSTNLNVWYNRLYKPDEFTDFGVHFDAWTIHAKTFTSMGFHIQRRPIETFDFFEPRVDGRYFTISKNTAGGSWFSSDYRKKFALDGRWSYRDYDDADRFNFNWSIEPRYRFSDKFKVVYEFERDIRHSQPGYVTDFSNDSIIFGRRDLLTHENSLEAEYIFNNKMALEFDFRHYWSKANYKAYNFLTADGDLIGSTYNENNDINFNAFTIDMTYTWRFAPGSDVIIVWKNSIFTDAPEIEKSFTENLKSTIDSPQTNSFSIKLLYYLDYLTFFGKKS